MTNNNAEQKRQHWQTRTAKRMSLILKTIDQIKDDSIRPRRYIPTDEERNRIINAIFDGAKELNAAMEHTSGGFSFEPEP